MKSVEGTNWIHSNKGSPHYSGPWRRYFYRGGVPYFMEGSDEHAVKRAAEHDFDHGWSAFAFITDPDGHVIDWEPGGL